MCSERGIKLTALQHQPLGCHGGCQAARRGEERILGIAGAVTKHENLHRTSSSASSCTILCGSPALHARPPRPSYRVLRGRCCLLANLGCTRQALKHTRYYSALGMTAVCDRSAALKQQAVKHAANFDLQFSELLIESTL